MASLADVMKQARAGSLARRPTIANGSTPAAAEQGGEFEGRTRLGGGAVLAIERIIPDPDQPRKTFGTEADQRLADSLRDRGQLVPILVRWSPEADRYVVIDGERRYRAAVQGGLAQMNCVVESEADPDTILELQLVTNALREDVMPVEQAKAWDRLMKSRGLTQQQLADKLGYERTTISKAFDLLALAPDLQARVDAGEIPASTAGEIGKRLGPEDQRAVVDQVVAEGLSRAKAVEVAERVARKKGQGTNPKRKGKPVTSWKHKGDGGWRLAVERPKGVDPAGLVEFLRSALVEAERQVAGAD